MSRLLQVLNSSHWTIFVTGNFNSLLNLILPLVLVRLFEPEDMGYYKIFFLYVGLIPFFTMTAGILTSVYYWVGDKVNFPPIASALWQSIFGLSLACALPVFAIVSFLLHDQNFNYFDILLITVSSVLAAPSALYGEYTMAQGRSLKSLTLGTSFEVTKVIGFITIAYFYRDMHMLFIFYAFMMIGSFLFMNTLAFREKAFSFNIDKRPLKKVFDYSLPISASAALVMIIEKADQLLLATFLTPTDYAYYTFGCLVVPSILILESSIQKKLIPTLSSHFQKQEYQQMAKTLRRGIEGIAFLTIPSICGLIIYADVIVELLYTKEFLEATIFLQVFAFSYLMYLIPHDSLLRSSGQSKILLKVNLIFALIFVGIIFSAAYFTNAITTLIISILLKLLYRSFLLHKSCRLLDIPFLFLFRSQKILIYTLLSVILSVLCWWGNRFYSQPIWAFIINGGLFALIYLGYFLKIKKWH